ncbi:DNA internalization-related competence protein ComEC/Rec2 [Anaerovibrio sp. JC8]|nr:DNA internalization-related competence protein ComEC/Rec2 [Anaerovibrio sp. JC8]
MLLALLVTGILLGRYFNCQPVNYGIWCGVLVLFGLVSIVLVYQKNKCSWLAIAGMILLLGLVRYFGAMNMGPLDIENWVEQEITVTGELVGAPVIRLDNEGKRHIKYVVNCQQLKVGGESSDTHGKIVLYARDTSYDDHKGHLLGVEGDEVFGRSGDSITVRGRLRKLHDYQNPGRMDMVMSQRAQGIHGQMAAGKYSIELSLQDKDVLGRLADRIRTLYSKKMEAVMPKEDSSAIFAMLFGGYGGIRPELLEAFAVTGLIHILSVSGSHITLMAGTANVFGKVLGLSGAMTAGLATLIIGVYSLLAGFTTPVIRSAIMGILTILALTMGREKDAQHILSITALGILLVWPLSLFDISFQLSFGATAGLLYLSPKIRKQLGRKMPRFMAGSLAVTMGAQLAVLPFLVWYFNVVSISSLLANILVEPIVELIIVISLMAGIVVGLLPVVGKLIFIGASLLLGAAYELSRGIARLPASQVYVPTMNYGFWLLYYGVLGLYIAPSEKRQKLFGMFKERIRKPGKRKGIIAGLVMLLVIGGIVYDRYPRELQVHFIDTLIPSLIQRKSPQSRYSGAEGIF